MWQHRGGYLGQLGICIDHWENTTYTVSYRSDPTDQPEPSEAEGRAEFQFGPVSCDIA